MENQSVIRKLHFIRRLQSSARLEQQPELNRATQITLPRMSFYNIELTDFNEK